MGARQFWELDVAGSNPVTSIEIKTQPAIFEDCVFLLCSKNRVRTCRFDFRHSKKQTPKESSFLVKWRLCRERRESQPCHLDRNKDTARNF